MLNLDKYLIIMSEIMPVDSGDIGDTIKVNKNWNNYWNILF